MGKKTGISESFGSRYGTMVRKRYTKVMKGVKEKHECPSCGYRKVKRKNFGVWICRKCGYTFTGGAYLPITKLGTTAARAVSSRTTQAPRREVTESNLEAKSKG